MTRRYIRVSLMFVDLMGSSMSAARQPWRDETRLGAEAQPVIRGTSSRTFVRREKHAPLRSAPNRPPSLSADTRAEEALRSMLAASHSRGFAGASARAVRLVMHDLSHCSMGSNSGNHNKPPWCLISCVKLIADRVLAKPWDCFIDRCQNHRAAR